jgi:hypothetical protein
LSLRRRHCKREEDFEKILPKSYWDDALAYQILKGNRERERERKRERGLGEMQAHQTTGLPEQHGPGKLYSSSGSPNSCYSWWGKIIP